MTRRALRQSAAWRTIERVNHARFQPGDRVRFEAGASFSGNLRLSAAEAGTSNDPVVIGSFGEGRATILRWEAERVSRSKTPGASRSQDLIVVGDGRTNNNGYGVCCDNTLADGSRLGFLRIANVEARDFGMFGILVSGTHAGFEHVAHHQLRDARQFARRHGSRGTSSLGFDRLCPRGCPVTHCQAFDNTGDPTYLKNHSGSGIVLYQVDGGVMEDCAAWNNGAFAAPAGGGVGLWVCASRRVVIQHCESFANRTSGGDGGGFDIDGGCQDCVLQYNYSHDNDGPGLMVYSLSLCVGFADRGAVVRFNISENDSRKGTALRGALGPHGRKGNHRPGDLQQHGRHRALDRTRRRSSMRAASRRACETTSSSPPAPPSRCGWNRRENRCALKTTCIGAKADRLRFPGARRPYRACRIGANGPGRNYQAARLTGLFADPALSRNSPASPASGERVDFKP